MNENVVGKIENLDRDGTLSPSLHLKCVDDKRSNLDALCKIYDIWLVLNEISDRVVNMQNRLGVIEIAMGLKK